MLCGPVPFKAQNVDDLHELIEAARDDLYTYSNDYQMTELLS
jgi:hypothetical protein